MDKRNEHLQNLAEIRSLMERSTRFISLSGLTGVAAGVFALLGAAAVYLYLDMMPFVHKRLYYVAAESANKWGIGYLEFFFLDATIVLVLAISTGIFFTSRKAKQHGQTIFDKSSLRMLLNLSIPLVVGGVFCLTLIRYGQFGLVAPSTLIFYGLALVNGSKYTLDDIRYLGYLEIILGLIAMNFVGYGLEFWALGFGILHIIYGVRMYFKYDRA